MTALSIGCLCLALIAVLATAMIIWIQDLERCVEQLDLRLELLEKEKVSTPPPPPR